MENRKKLLGDLILNTKPLDETLASLSQYSWDSEDELVILTRKDLAFVLERYLKFELSSQEVEDWANAIEGRDDIGFESGYSELVSDTIFELANPLLTEELNPNHAKAILESILTP